MILFRFAYLLIVVGTVLYCGYLLVVGPWPEAGIRILVTCGLCVLSLIALGIIHRICALVVKRSLYPSTKLPFPLTLIIIILLWVLVGSYFILG